MRRKSEVFYALHWKMRGTSSRALFVCYLRVCVCVYDGDATALKRTCLAAFVKSLDAVIFYIWNLFARDASHTSRSLILYKVRCTINILYSMCQMEVGLNGIFRDSSASQRTVRTSERGKKRYVCGSFLFLLSYVQYSLYCSVSFTAQFIETNKSILV